MIDPERTAFLRELAREVLADPTVRVDVMPERYGDGQRITLCVRSVVSFRVADDMPLQLVKQQVRDGYVTLAEELREQLKLRLSALGT